MCLIIYLMEEMFGNILSAWNKNKTSDRVEDDDSEEQMGIIFIKNQHFCQNEPYFIPFQKAFTDGKKLGNW